MFDFNWSEIALIGVVALIFIGPKDMPAAIKGISTLLKKGRKLAGEFQTHVDEMVRDADLGEARESFRELRSLNLRSQVAKVLDNDGSLRRTLSENPLGPVPAASASAIPGAEPQTAALEGTGTLEQNPAEMLRQRNAPFGAPVMTELGAAVSESREDPAPASIPPTTANRLRTIRATPRPPAFIPPQARRIVRTRARIR